MRSGWASRSTAALVIENSGGARRSGGARADAGRRRPGARIDPARASTCPRRAPPASSLPCVPTRRGDRAVTHVPCAARPARARGPPGLAARARTLSGCCRRSPRASTCRAKLARLRELDGRTSLRIRGQGTEFDSLRDYVIGDDVRSIDWRATARRQQVVVRTWRPERDRRVLLLLDTSRTSAGRVGDEPRLDAAMDAALLLAALASRAGDRVDMIAMDRRVRRRVEGASRPTAAARWSSAMRRPGARPRGGGLDGDRLPDPGQDVPAGRWSCCSAPLERGGRGGGPAAGACTG